MQFSDKDLTIALLSIFIEKKVSIDNLKKLFSITEDDAKKIVETLIERKAIFNFDFTKKEMSCISYDDLDNIAKSTGKSENDLLKEFCFCNPNMSVDGTLKEVEKLPLDDDLIQRALSIATEMGSVSATTLQKELKISYSRAVQVLERLKSNL